MRTDIDADLLRAFVAVADGGSFTGAARALNRTQSAVSMQIKRLEAVTHARLFDRAGRCVRLTRDGETLIAYARRILALNDEALSIIAANRVAGMVRLGVMDDYATCLLPDILGRFATGHPQVYLEVRTGLTAHMLPRLGEQFDLVLAMHRAGSGEGEVVRREQAVWAASRTHQPERKEVLPLALAPQGCLFREWALAALDVAGRRWRIAYVSESLGAIEAAVAAGLAVSVFKAGTLSRRLRLLGPEDGLPPLPLADIALHRASHDLSPPAARLADFIARELSHPGA